MMPYSFNLLFSTTFNGLFMVKIVCKPNSICTYRHANILYCKLFPGGNETIANSKQLLINMHQKQHSFDSTTKVKMCIIKLATSYLSSGLGDLISLMLLLPRGLFFVLNVNKCKCTFL